MATEEHTVRYELRPGDNWILTRYLFRSSPRYWVLHGGLVVGTAWLAASVRGLERGDGAFDSALFASVALFMAVFDFAVQRLKSSHRERRTVGLLGAHELRIAPDGLHGMSDGLESSISWTRVERLVVTEGWFYLFLNRTSAVIVPLTAFATDAEQATFVTAAERWLAAGRSG